MIPPKKVPGSPSFELLKLALERRVSIPEIKDITRKTLGTTLGVGVVSYDVMLAQSFTFIYDVLHLSSGRDKVLAFIQNFCKWHHAGRRTLP